MHSKQSVEAPEHLAQGKKCLGTAGAGPGQMIAWVERERQVENKLKIAHDTSGFTRMG